MKSFHSLNTFIFEQVKNKIDFLSVLKECTHKMNKMEKLPLIILEQALVRIKDGIENWKMLYTMTKDGKYLLLAMNFIKMYIDMEIVIKKKQKEVDREMENVFHLRYSSSMWGTGV
jgi:hypothetical protein